MAVALAQTPARGEVYLVQLDPTRGVEIRKTRPCIVISPNELNQHLRTVIVAPLTTQSHAYPWRPRCRFQGKAGYVVIDQLRTVDVQRLTKRLGQIPQNTLTTILNVLHEMFAF
ncbi:MAG: type II toxin-antitoxin system PemK/MazF family toxin [Deltaproteobacteria bacterium]|nr:type II toxin-antitoxin system PemK/MazF family toxin [Deltaproteobacteria bacterium]